MKGSLSDLPQFASNCCLIVCYKRKSNRFPVIISRNSPIPRTSSDIFERTTSALAVTRAPNAEKPSRHRQDLSSIRTSIRRWSHFSARSALKPTHSSPTCVVTSACTPIAVCKLSVISADRVSAQSLHYRSTSGSVTQPEPEEISRAINLNSNRSKFHPQCQRRRTRICCCAITRHSSHQDSRRFPACREFSHRTLLKHRTFLCCFQSTTLRCHLWMSLTERLRLN